MKQLLTLFILPIIFISCRTPMRYSSLQSVGVLGHASEHLAVRDGKSHVEHKTDSLIRPAHWAKKLEVPGFRNLYKVDDNLYRAEQPGRKDMIYLDSIGVKTIVNLRHVWRDNRKARNTKLKLKHVPINTWNISYDEVVESLRVILNSDKPVLVHCIHGSDRTGCIVAAYRMVKSGWTKEEAIREFVYGGFGYHQKWFPNILRLLNNIDVAKLKSDVLG